VAWLVVLHPHNKSNKAENENIDTFDKSVAYKTVYGITPFRTRKKQKYFVLQKIKV